MEFPLSASTECYAPCNDCYLCCCTDSVISPLVTTTGFGPAKEKPAKKTGLSSIEGTCSTGLSYAPPIISGGGDWI